MSNIEEAIQELVDQQVQEVIDTAIDDNYTITDLRDRIEMLEEQINGQSNNDMIEQLATVILDSVAKNKVIVSVSYVEDLKRQIEKLTTKEEV
jgi:polyhydroxyalkanoate synthesis regulator protein